MWSSPAVRLVDPGAVAPLGPLPSGAQAAAEEADTSAWEAGVEAGRAMALAEEGAALASARRAMDRAAAALASAAEELRAARAEALAVEAPGLVAFALRVVEALAGELPPRLTPARLAEALELVPAEELPVLRLHPEDLETVGELPLDAKVLADPTVERGGCVVEVGPTRVDAQRGPALARLRAALGEVA